jgi:hypothetical protein
MEDFTTEAHQGADIQAFLSTLSKQFAAQLWGEAVHLQPATKFAVVSAYHV